MKFQDYDGVLRISCSDHTPTAEDVLDIITLMGLCRAHTPNLVRNVVSVTIEDRGLGGEHIIIRGFRNSLDDLAALLKWLIGLSVEHEARVREAGWPVMLKKSTREGAVHHHVVKQLQSRIRTVQVLGRHLRE